MREVTVSLDCLVYLSYTAAFRYASVSFMALLRPRCICVCDGSARFGRHRRTSSLKPIKKTPKLRRYERFRRCRRVFISDFFRRYYHSGPNFWSSFRRYIRFVVISDVVINDLYCILFLLLKIWNTRSRDFSNLRCSSTFVPLLFYVVFIFQI